MKYGDIFTGRLERNGSDFYVCSALGTCLVPNHDAGVVGNEYIFMVINVRHIAADDTGYVGEAYIQPNHPEKGV